MSLKVNMTCSCGARFDMEDTQGVFWHADEISDDKNRRFIIERKMDEWLELHQKCLFGKNHEFKSIRSELPDRIKALEIEQE